MLLLTAVASFWNKADMTIGGNNGVSWGEEFFIEKFGGCSLSGAAARTGNLSKKEKGKWKNKEHVEFYQE